MGLGVQRGLLEACGTARQGTGKFHDGDGLVRTFPSLSANEMGCKEITCAAPDESKFLSEEKKARLSHIYTTTQALLRGRTLSYLKEGNYGTVPDFTESGDLVCLLMGCSALVILRK